MCYTTALLFLKEWQTLTAGLLALVASMFTIRQIRKQIAQSYDQFEQTKDRKRNAAYSSLPFALSLIGKSSLDWIKYIDGHYLRHCRQRIDTESEDQPDPIPTEVTNILRECVEFSKSDCSEKIAVFMRELQVANSRMDCIIGNTEYRLSPRKYEELFVNQAKIYLNAEPLYPDNKGPIKAIEDIKIKKFADRMFAEDRISQEFHEQIRASFY